MPLPANYRVNKRISALAMRLMKLGSGRSPDLQVDLRREPIHKILLVRGNFRMGDSVLAAPAIHLFRKNFPDATIDFVGSPMSRMLFENLPIDRHYEITRRFPDAMWSYFSLIRRLRAFHYDLAVEVSGSQSAMGAFLVGFCGARFRAGLRGKRDRWLNIRLPRPAERNKYKSLPALVAALGLESEDISPRLILTEAEKSEGKRRLAAAGLSDGVVGVFTGGRVSRLKRWPPENFVALAAALKSRGAKVALFVGPEETDLIPYFQKALGADVPVLFEPAVRGFAAMVAACALFITSDSGPMHLACAVGTRTIAMFQKADHRHWGPPQTICRIVYQQGGATVEQVLQAALDEWPRAARAGAADAQRLA